MNKPLDKKTRPLLWILSSLVLGIIFIAASIPKATAQNLPGVQSQRPYTAIIQNVFDFIQRNYVDEIDPQTLFEGTMDGMFKSLGDPHSSFLPQREMEDLSDTTSGRFGGVGLYISKPQETNPDGTPPFVEVASPIEDTPGWQAGINPGDLIVEINGEPTDVLSMDAVLSRLRGVPGTDVNLLIRRGTTLEFPVVLTRAVIEVPVIKHEMIGDIGYMRIISFTPMTVARTREALAGFADHGYKSLIVDLRNNPGGLLEAAVGVCELFLDGGVVVSTKSRIASENYVYNARRRPAVAQDVPVIVLINRGSASASEIVAGALKDRGRAYLVGEKSFGKGSVQKVFPVGENAGFRLTTARYFTPSDVNIDKIGIPPDREVLFPEFSAEDAEKLNEIIAANTVPLFVKENPQASAPQINAFVEELHAKYGLDISLLRRLVRNEQNRTVIAPVYDLEYDVQLQEAVNILRSGNYTQLMKTSKTLKDLQEEADDSLPLAS
ncbi:MAG: S41 family peptidase [Spirochaetaceae bacterium]|jgi:carboxyl-terminal processing protease|nr:S41 family peptidase [Spirochaetaceae bacterium]